MVFPFFLTVSAYLSCTFRGCTPDCLVNVVATNAQISCGWVLCGLVGGCVDGCCVGGWVGVVWVGVWMGVVWVGR